LARIRNISFDHVLFKQDSLPDEFKDLEENFIQRLTDFRKLPLMDMLEALIDLLALNEVKGELAYLSGFKEAIYDFTAKNRADLGGFLTWWEQQGYKRTVKIPEELDAIRVQTIHKSKGLQYKVVLLPYLDWRLFDTGKDNIIWTKYDWDENSPSAIVPLTIRNQLLNTAFSAAFLEENLLNYLDSLNMLYVAFTRAEEVLLAMTPYKKPNNKSSLSTVADLLIAIMDFKIHDGKLLDFDAFYDRENLVFDMGDWHHSKKKESPYPSIQAMSWKYKPWERTLKVRQVFGEFETSEIIAKRAFGVLVHRMIEKSQTKKEFLLELQTRYFDGAVTDEEKLLLESQFEKLCQQSVFYSWFDGSGHVLTEQGIFLPGGAFKRPDRIIYKVDRIEVIDFKTGEERAAHKEQVLQYVELVRSIEKEKIVLGYICYIESGLIVKVN
jgi:ATP-dependent exoDNAse (exonuclease V) beta subunit